MHTSDLHTCIMYGSLPPLLLSAAFKLNRLKLMSDSTAFPWLPMPGGYIYIYQKFGTRRRLCSVGPQPPTPNPRGEGGRYCHNIALCSGHCIDIDICDRGGGGGALFFTFPLAASTYKRVGKTCLIFHPIRNTDFTLLTHRPGGTR